MRGLRKAGLPAAVAAVVLTACAPAPEFPPWHGQDESDSPVKACLVSDQAGFNDKSFNQSAKEGLDRAVAELGVRSATTESSGPGDFKQNIENLIAQNCTLVFGVAFTLNDAIRRAAEINTDIDFVLIDSRITLNFEEVHFPNAKALVFNTAEASFLAGYLAAGMSENGAVGTWGGMQIPPVVLFMDGWDEGVKAYNETHGTSVRVLGWSNASQRGSFAGGFQDQARGNQLTQGQISQGADVIMPVAGNAGNGALAAARANPGTAIVWVDFDGYETTDFGDLILTSVVKNVGQAVYETIESQLEDAFTSEAYIGDLANDGVGLASFHEFEDVVPQELKDELDSLRQQIIDGTLVVETVNQP